MSRDMPAPDGRSKAVSTDVADTVEGLMPSLMDIFTAADEVVRFEPVGPEDVAAAEQERDYVNHVFMQQNAGFIVLYSFIKDALLSKVGIVKVWWESASRRSARPITISTMRRSRSLPRTPRSRSSRIRRGGHRIAQSASGEEVQSPIRHVADAPFAAPRRHSADKTHASGARVEGVPPEEFGIERGARRCATANYCFHEFRSEARLIAQGFDREQIRRLPSHGAAERSRRWRATPRGGHADQGDERPIRQPVFKVTEHYIRMDYEG